MSLRHLAVVVRHQFLRTRAKCPISFSLSQSRLRFNFFQEHDPSVRYASACRSRGTDSTSFRNASRNVRYASACRSRASDSTFFRNMSQMSHTPKDCCRLALLKEVESVARLRQAEAYRTFRLALRKEVESVARLRQAEAFEH